MYIFMYLIIFYSRAHMLSIEEIGLRRKFNISGKACEK